MIIVLQKVPTFAPLLPRNFPFYLHLMLQNIKEYLVILAKVRTFASPSSQVNTCNRVGFGKSST